jgi:hypothetical protein
MTQETYDFGFIKAIRSCGFSDSATLASISLGGSTRKFYRLNDGQKSVVIMQSQESESEFVKYIEIDKFLKEIGVGVPEIYYYDLSNKLVVEEDLGDLSVQKYIINAGDFNIYKQVMDTLALMQVMGAQKSHGNLFNPNFDYDTMRWETWYFRQYFLELYCGLKINNPDELDKEFHKLAMSLVNEPLYFMHRDFQSQNILLKDNKIRIIDFQGARLGLLAYDLASLLKDAYVEMPDKTREGLLDYYLNCLSIDWNIEIEPNYFRNIFLYTGLQRNMQALGAFAYLSRVANKPWFAQYIPQGLRYLYDALTTAQNFPELLKTISPCLKLFE